MPYGNIFYFSHLAMGVCILESAFHDVSWLTGVLLCSGVYMAGTTQGLE